MSALDHPEQQEARVSSPPSQNNAMSVAAVITTTARILHQAGIADSRREARLLLAAASGLDQSVLIAHPDQPVKENILARLGNFARHRRNHCPLGRILGSREFWSLPFRVAPWTLEPRPDSECLVAAAVSHLKAAVTPDREEGVRILDLGVGTGCLLLSVLHEIPRAHGIGVDIDPRVCRTAGDNARLLGLADRAQWVVGDWATALKGSFDAILCNPPYIPDGAMASLMPEVARYDPRRALAGGVDGLDCYRRLLPMLGPVLKPTGALFLEIGHDQAPHVAACAAGLGWRRVETRRDLAGHPRCLVLATGANDAGKNAAA